MPYRDQFSKAFNVLRRETGEASVSIGEALSGSGTEIDTTHRNLLNRIHTGRNFKGIQAYAISADGSNQDYGGLFSKNITECLRSGEQCPPP